MKTNLKITAVVVLALMMLFSVRVFAQKTKNPVRVLLVTGGHGFDRDAMDVFKKSLPGIDMTEVQHPNALAMFRPENRTKFDVALFYDMPNVINEQEKKDLLDYLNGGKGMIIWHHAFASYPDWPEFESIMGGRYFLKQSADSKGVEHPASTYQHDVKFRVKVVDKKHPITKGLSDFDILDETYGICKVNPEVNVLLSTDEPTSTPSVAWSHKYGKSKVVTILLGHDNHAWTNPSFAKLLTQAIFWVK